MLLVCSIIGVFGLLIGSFLNVLIYRIPKKIFFDKKRSFCPSCGKTLKWYELIPVLSYVFLLGKCKSCKAKISPRYPIVELLNALLYILVYLYHGVDYITIIYMLMLSALLVMSFIDIDTMEIPNGLVLFLIILGVINLILSLFVPSSFKLTWWEYLVGSIIVSGFLYIVFLLSNGGIGGGDIKLMFGIGFILGYKLVIIAGLAGFIIGGVLGVVTLFANKENSGKTQIPLGPSLAIGTLIALIYGNSMINWYLGLLG